MVAILSHASFSSLRPCTFFNRRQHYFTHSVSTTLSLSHPHPQIRLHHHHHHVSLPSHFTNPSIKHTHFLTKSFRNDNAENSGEGAFVDDDSRRDGVIADLNVNQESKPDKATGSFLAKLAIALGVAVVVTLISIRLKQSVPVSSLFGIQCLNELSSSSVSAASAAGFSFKAFGYRVVLPEYAPGWVYFWLLMAAGCGLFISEEALNIWVGISLSRLLSVDGTWRAFVESFSRNAPYIISTFIWVYLGVCISDMIPFYLGKLFGESKASGDVYSTLGIGEERALSLTKAVNRYGNLIGFVERFSVGVRNPTAFLAGALGISPECFFAGVCFGGLITVPLQFAIGFVLRERPLFAIATVATAVGIWTLFPYGLAASTALFLYLRQRYSS